MTRHSSRTLYVGNLPGDTREREVEDIFYKYGPIVDIDLKIPPRPPGYAFVEFEDYRDAEDAVHYRDGYNFDGHRLRVEFAHGGRSLDRSSGYGRGFSSSNSYSDGGRGVPKYSEYRVIVTGLPSSASWQDLKDHMRRAGDVNFSQVFRDRYGVYGTVDYTNYEDMKYAIRKLDNSKFKNAFSSSYVRVREYDSRRSSSRSYSHSPSRSRGRSSSRSSSFYSRGRSKSPKAKDIRRSLSLSKSVSSNSYSELSRRAYSRSRSISPPTSHYRRKQLSVSPRECILARNLTHSRSHSPL